MTGDINAITEQRKILEATEGTILSAEQKSVDDAEAAKLTSTVVDGLATLFYAIYHIWLEDAKYVCLKENLEGILGVIGERGDYRPAWEAYVDLYVVPEDRAELRKFANIDTLPERLQHQNFITHTYRRSGVGWTSGQFIVAKRNEQGVATHVLYVVKDINEEIKLEKERKKIAYQAEHDRLTDTWNRQGLDRLIKCDRFAKKKMGLLLMDIDLFKSINDDHGHAFGDETLHAVAKFLQAAFRKTDEVCRLGGDEFLVLMENCDVSVWHSICRKLSAMHEAFKDYLPNGKRCTFSAGVVFSENGFSKEMYDVVDKALYNTKNMGRCGATLMNLDGKLLEEWHDSTNLLERSVSRRWMYYWRIEISDAVGKKPRMYVDAVTYQIFDINKLLTPEEIYDHMMGMINADDLWRVEKMFTTAARGGRVETTCRIFDPAVSYSRIRSCCVRDEKYKEGVAFYGYDQDITNIMEI